MTEENRITAKEAQAALESAEKAGRKLLRTFRPPLWANVLTALMFSCLIISHSLKAQSSLWTAAFILSLFYIIASGPIWYYRCHARGLMPRFIPASLSGKVITAGAGIMSGLMLAESQDMFARGIPWAPYVAAVLGFFLWLFAFHYFPAGERLGDSK